MSQMTRYAFYFNSEICTGCKTCSVACKESHHLPLGVVYRKVFDIQGGSWSYDEAVDGYVADGIFAYFISTACNHCERPACKQACLNGAIVKDGETGVVRIDAALCRGCGTCVAACPYHAVALDPAGSRALKCDMCEADIKAGRKPLCVRSCKMRCLDWGEYDALVEQYGEGDVQVAPLPLDVTGPSLVQNPHHDARPSGSTDCVVVSLKEEYQ